MREIQSSEAGADLSGLLDSVENGETIVIIRDGKRIARIVPETDHRPDHVAQVLAEIETFRKTMPSIPLEEILSARHEGHRF